MRGVCAEPYAQDRANIQRIVCTTENTTKSRIYITNTFQNYVEKWNIYQCRNRRRRPKPTLASLLFPAYSISYLSMTVKALCWYCSCVYGKSSVKKKSKTKRILPTLMQH